MAITITDVTEMNGLCNSPLVHRIFLAFHEPLKFQENKTIYSEL